jgi:DNA-binding NtrC family response regulator
MENISKSRKKKVKGMSKDIVKAFMEYDWPGNVRELENIIERMIILAEEDELTIQDLPDKIIEKHHRDEDAVEPVIPEEGFSLNNAINDYERMLIVRALEKADWVKNRAAKILNMNRTTLVEKIKKQGIERPRRAMN